MGGTLMKLRPTYVAIFDYEAAKVDEISCKKGDVMKKIKTKNEDWIVLRNNSEEGLIPSNHVAKFGTLEAEDWFFKNFTRQDAVENLLANPKFEGKFLVRTPETCQRNHQYSVSILAFNTEKKDFHVKHFRVNQNNEGRFYIKKEHAFSTLSKLVQYYQKNKTFTKSCEKTEPLVFHEWEIERNEIVLGAELGAGNFGEVFEGTWRKKRIAVKTLKKGSMDPQKFLEEADIMKQIRHKNLVALYGICKDTEPYYIVQEFMANGSLLSCLRKNPIIFHFKDLIYLSAQIASGMHYLECKQLIHRDLAARNVLIGEKNVAKICDFGLARIIDDEIYEATTITKMPVKWTAPEALDQNQYSIKSDVWSFGILLTEIFSYGAPPYGSMKNAEVLNKIKHENYRMPKPTNKIFEVSDIIYNLMLECWRNDSQSRPTFERLKCVFENFETENEKSYSNLNEYEIPDDVNQQK